MPIEVEVKARIGDSDRIRERIVRREGPGAPFLRRDAYFVSPDGERRFRCRREDERCTVTSKIRHLDDGVEQNDEVEFRVDDADAFGRFVAHLGYVPLVTKEKRGEVWRIAGDVVELSDVATLGVFVEIERILPDGATPAEIAAASAAVLARLTDLGVPASAIETRPYTEMLLDDRA